MLLFVMRELNDEGDQTRWVRIYYPKNHHNKSITIKICDMFEAALEGVLKSEFAETCTFGGIIKITFQDEGVSVIGDSRSSIDSVPLNTDASTLVRPGSTHDLRIGSMLLRLEMVDR